MYMEGGFVEVIHDKKQYYLSEICKEFHLPFNVKVSVRDLSIEKDVLAAVPGLQFEEEITDSYLLISSANSPAESWEIPVYRSNMLVHLLSKDEKIKDDVPPVTRTTVEEISEEEYYMLRRYENLTLHPPPRPPKKPTTAPPPSFASPKQGVSDVLQAPKVRYPILSLNVLQPQVIFCGFKVFISLLYPYGMYTDGSQLPVIGKLAITDRNG